jgi:hypothetical protein
VTPADVSINVRDIGILPIYSKLKHCFISDPLSPPDSGSVPALCHLSRFHRLMQPALGKDYAQQI